MAEGGDGRPRERLSGADAVTLARFWLVLVVPAVARSPAGLPLVIALGGLSDWADGALARRSRRTRLGRDLDSTADLALLATAGRRCARGHGERPCGSAGSCSARAGRRGSGPPCWSPAAPSRRARPRRTCRACEGRRALQLRHDHACTQRHSRRRPARGPSPQDA